MLPDSFMNENSLLPEPIANQILFPSAETAVIKQDSDGPGTIQNVL